jgi:hypothetical protein
VIRLVISALGVCLVNRVIWLSRLIRVYMVLRMMRGITITEV